MFQRLDGAREANCGLGSLSRHSSFRRAVCVNALVRNLRGGRSAMIVPTATARRFPGNPGDRSRSLAPTFDTYLAAGRVSVCSSA
jgi:hypothetical protein